MPVANATVIIISVSGEKKTITTDAEGKFSTEVTDLNIKENDNIQNQSRKRKPSTCRY